MFCKVVGFREELKTEKGILSGRELGGWEYIVLNRIILIFMFF